MPYIRKYWDAIERGEIIVGDELKVTLRHLLRETEDREYMNSHDLYFDCMESYYRIQFIEKKLKLFEAPFAGQPFKLELFQKAFIEAIFAIKQYEDKQKRYVRKYQWVLFLVGRKNGKTPLVAAISLAEWVCGPMGLKILCASNNYAQASILHGAINAMREESPELERVTRKNIRGIYWGNPRQKNKRGKFSMQNKGSIEKLSAKTGAKEGLNIGVAAIDEVHEMEDDRLVMPIRQAFSSQDEPLCFELTTEGFVNDGYLDKRLAEARKVLESDYEAEAGNRWLIWLYTQDCESEVWTDERSWQKSNPGLGTIKKEDFLREMVDEARTNKSTRAFVLAKDFNIKQNGATAWLSETELAALDGKTFDLEMIEGTVGIGGCDLSESGDLTNARILFVDPENRNKYFVTMYFLPEVKADDNPKYREWAAKGYLTLCEGGEVNHGDVADWFWSFWLKHRCKVFRVGYDKWQAKGFVAKMEGYDYDMEKISQGEGLSNAMLLFENDLAQGKIYTNDNPMDRFCFANTAVRWNSKGTRRQPEKLRGEVMKKIDGAVTTLICYETLDRYRSEYMEVQKNFWALKNKK